MDSILTLGLGRLEIDWGKKYYNSNHSKLFLPEDTKFVTYHYFDSETKKAREEVKLGLSRPLRSVKRRLELLGYTLSKAKRHYEEVSQNPNLLDPPVVNFEVFAEVLAAADVNKVALDPWFMDHNPGYFAARSILGNPEFTKTSKDLENLSRFHGLFLKI